MNKLAIEKKYEKVVEIFLKNMRNYTIANSNSKNVKHQKLSELPYDQLSLCFEALLNMVTLFSYQYDCHKKDNFFPLNKLKLPSNKMKIPCIIKILILYYFNALMGLTRYQFLASDIYMAIKPFSESFKITLFKDLFDQIIVVKVIENSKK